MLGIDVVQMPELAFLAEEARIRAQLPPPLLWSSWVDHGSGRPYYRNELLGQTQWEHPALSRMRGVTAALALHVVQLHAQGKQVRQSVFPERVRHSIFRQLTSAGKATFAHGSSADSRGPAAAPTAEATPGPEAKRGNENVRRKLKGSLLMAKEGVTGFSTFTIGQTELTSVSEDVVDNETKHLEKFERMWAI